MMKEYKKQDALNKEIFKQQVKVKIMENDSKTKPKDLVKDQKKLIKMKIDDNNMEENIRKKYPSIKSYDDLPTIGCFIIFDDVEAANACYQDYRANQYSYKDRLKLLEKHKIKVNYADDPANINWENLEVSKFESSWRTTVVLIIAVLLLIITFILVYAMRSYQNQLPEPKDCEKYVEYTVDTVDTSNNNAVDCVCMKAGFFSAMGKNV